MMRRLSRLDVAPRDDEVRCIKALFARVSRLLLLASLLALLWVSSVSLASAEAAAIDGRAGAMVAPDALSGGRYVGSAFDPQAGLRLLGSVGFGHTEEVLGEGDRHQRYLGELAAAYVFWPSLQLSIASELRYDRHTSDSGDDSGFMVGTRVTSRHALAVRERVSLALQTGFAFPGAQNAARGLRSVSPSLAALVSYRAHPSVSLSALLGYRLDRSAHSVRDPAALTRADRLAASISEHDAALVGAMVTYAAQPITAIAEWSWDLSTVATAPAAHSPMRVRLAAQRTWLERLVPGAEVVFDVSRRPSVDGPFRIEPRVVARISLGVLFEDAAQSRAKPAQVAAPPAAPVLVPFRLKIVDDQGAPVVSARVLLARDSSGQEHLSDEQGEVALLLSRGVTAVSIEKEGFESHWQTLHPGRPASAQVVLGRSLPAAEIKGAVRNLSGDPLIANIELQPLGVAVTTSANGQFVMNVAPGHYILKITAEGYETQQRPVTVELRGVTILVIDLRRSHP